MNDARVAQDGEVDVWVCAEAPERSGVAVEEVLRRYASASGPGRLYARDGYGRPSVRGRPDLCISVSHTRGVVLLAVGRCRLGVDVESVRERGLARLPHHALTEWERGELERQAAHRETEVFLSYWTRKEALLKAVGLGLAIDPKLIELPPRRSALHPVRVPAELGRPEQWSIVELDVEGCVAAVAADALAPRVHVIPLELDGGPALRPMRPPNADLS